MAKKKRSPKSVSSNDETIRIDADEVVSSNPEASVDENIDSTNIDYTGTKDQIDATVTKGQIDATVTMDSTLNLGHHDEAVQSDTNAVTSADSPPKSNPANEKTVAFDKSELLDKTVAFDKTVPLDKTIEFDKSAPIDKTVSDHDVDQTVAIPRESSTRDANRSSVSSGTVVSRGGLSQSVDSSGSIDGTTVGLSGGGSDHTVAIGGSMLSSPQIGATVNPRELSAEEADQWSLVVGSNASENRSVDTPAIDRTFSDRHFARLRMNTIAESHSDPSLPSDYRLNRKLGQGGMGDVYLARQKSLDRLLALKVIKPLDEKRRQQLMQNGRLQKVEEERQMQFLAEAIITGDLDHPNIVPIHDVAMTKDGNLFYSMKRVDGTPWSDQLNDMSQSENLDVLLRVCDAVGFAHTRNVVHRDIKPENIMLGDFGVVMVMDWGLALPTSEYDKEKQSSILLTSGLGGTPAFMAPEMATGPLAKIGPTADIYLLGATLFMIVTGQAPHHARNVSECLKVVRTNEIRPVDEKHKGELLDIALQAMATDPKNRFQSVGEFQDAIRNFIAHDQSIGQTNRAYELLTRGKKTRNLAEFHRATQGFEEAIKSWSGNDRAREGLAETTITHAEFAYETGEYESGISILDSENPAHTELLDKLIKARDERESRVARLRLLRRLTAAMLAFILVGGTVALFFINMQRNLAIASADLAEKQTKIAQDQTEFAETETKRAEEQELLAVSETKKAESAAKLAREAENAERDAKLAAIKSEKAAKENEQRALDAEKDAREAQAYANRERESARYEEYVSKIGLAKARLETNDGKGARKILEELKSSPRSNGWEWRWLWQQANQSLSDVETDTSVIDLSLSSDRRRAAVATSDGHVSLLQFDDDGKIAERQLVDADRLNHQRATAVALSPDHRSIAVGTQSGDVIVLSIDRDEVVTAHTNTVNDLQFSSDGRLFSGSSDRTVRVLSKNEGSNWEVIATCWHLSPVRQIAVQGQGSNTQMAAATSDQVSGRVAFWSIPATANGQPKQTGVFTLHDSPVSAIAISNDGRLAASGDAAGNVLIWKPSSLSTVNYGKSIDRAIATVDPEAINNDGAQSLQADIRFVRLVDSALDRRPQFVSTSSATTAPSPKSSVAHSDVIRSIRFAANNDTIVTASDDYTLKLWGIAQRDLRTTMRGHGGWVVSADFLSDATESIVSGSNDASVRTWKPANYHGAFVTQSIRDDSVNDGDTQEPSLKRSATAHQSEIKSAKFSPDGTEVVTASRDHTARILKINPETLAFEESVRFDTSDEPLAEGTPYVAMSMEIDVPGNRLFIGSADATIRIWDLRRAVEVDQVRGTGLNSAFAVSADGKSMLTGSSSPAVKAILWRLDPTGTKRPVMIHQLKGHDQAVTAFAISSDGSRIFTGDRGGYGILWDTATGSTVGPPIEDVRGFRINAAAFSPDGTSLYLAADDEQLTKIDVASRRRMLRLNHNGFVTQFALSRDETSVVTLSELLTDSQLTTTATYWNLANQASQTLSRVTDNVDSNAKQNRQGRRRIHSVRWDDEATTATVCLSSPAIRQSIVNVYDIASIKRGNDPSKVVRSFEVPGRLETTQIAIPIGRDQLMTMNQNAAFQWDLGSSKLIRSFRSHAELTEASFSADAKYVATASRSVKIWDASTGAALAKLETPHMGPVSSVTFASNSIGGQPYAFATGGPDGVVRLWSWDPESKTVSPISSMGDGDARSIHRVRFSPDSKRLMIVGDGGRVAVWIVGDKAPRWTSDLPAAGDFVCAAFSPDGNAIAVGGTDYRVRVWQLDDQVAGGPLGAPSILDGHADVIRDVAMLGAGDTLRVLTASSDDSARVWDPRLGTLDPNQHPEPGREIVSLRRHVGDVTSVDTTDGGNLLMTAGHDGTVILWPAVASHAIESNNLFDALDESGKAVPVP
ncbi:Serine/threonine-protein kinase PknD [Rubripirellula tenax]|uniref:Serine/threonine-protein kinase PknD n=1 Tax=Rubripirellula tenax TaxID=2528015 RepID=A0A5C6FCX0_9BACT|nr:protein kinase [Rubripirellula tenax]TWU59308.1 Serine/threonine-protein kinase PknD [Rubripirellula tenax]